MPGWTNVWTMPIQNRVDMLATGVNTPIGVRVLGRNLDDVVRGSEEVARVVKGVPGAVDVVADPIRGKPYIEIRLDRERAARLGVRAGEVNELIETALAGKVGHDDRRGPRAAPGGRPLRPRLARGRRVGAEPPRDRLRRVAGPGSSSSTVPVDRRLVRSRSPRSPRFESSRAPRRSRAKTGSCAITSG